MDRKEGAEPLHDDTLTDERETQICACVCVSGGGSGTCRCFRSHEKGYMKRCLDIGQNNVIHVSSKHLKILMCKVALFILSHKSLKSKEEKRTNYIRMEIHYT